MGLFAASIGERVSVRAGLALLGPLVSLAGSAACSTGTRARRRAAATSARTGSCSSIPMLAMPLMMALFPPRYTRGADLGRRRRIYAAAKVLEALDAARARVPGSGERSTIKHLCVALAGGQVAPHARARAPLMGDTR